MENVVKSNLERLKELSDELSDVDFEPDNKLINRYRKLVREIKSLVNDEYSETDSEETRKMACERICQKIKLLLSKTN
jgi:hypothetical protein